MQTEEAENSGDSIPLSPRGAPRVSALHVIINSADLPRDAFCIPGCLIQEDPAK